MYVWAIQVLYLDENAGEEDLKKALSTGARWLLLSPTLRPEVRLLE